jgi:DNA repair exonuclease SbcCD ATPase subunit
MSVRLIDIRIEGFRGFAEPVEIDLDADAVIVRGDNGTGKTSLIDALLWLFTGSLPHLAERQRGVPNPEDVVVNRYNSSGDARVMLTVAVDHERRAFTRTGRQDETQLIAARSNGETASGSRAAELLATSFEFDTLEELQRAVATWGVLRQDALRAALDVTGGALYERLSGLIGLKEVSRFVEACERSAEALVTHREKAERELSDAEEQRERMLALLRKAQVALGLAEERGEILTHGLLLANRSLGSVVELERPTAVEVTHVARAGTVLRELHRHAWVVVESEREMPLPRVTPGELARATQEARVAAEEADRVLAEVSNLSRMAHAARHLLGDRCPVCEQTIDADVVAAHLDALTGDASGVGPRVRATQYARVEAEGRLSGLETRFQIQEEVAARAAAGRADLRAFAGKVGDVLTLEASGDDEDFEELLDGLREAIEHLRVAQQEVDYGPGRVARAEAHVEEAERSVDAAREQLDLVDTRHRHAIKLARAAAGVSHALTAEALEKLAPSFAEVFDRLSPNPAFTELYAKQVVSWKGTQVVPMVRDGDRGVEANPVLIFSEGQLNVVALSYFLGMALTAREATLPFLILDDPLQSLDVVAILGFSDLCRHIRDERQLIVTTHDRRFADVLERKLTPRVDPAADAAVRTSLIVHHLNGWTRGGPIVETEPQEPQPVEFILRE